MRVPDDAARAARQLPAVPDRRPRGRSGGPALARPGDRADRTRRNAAVRRHRRLPYAARRRGSGGGRLSRRAAVPPPGRRDRGRARPVRLGGARARDPAVPGRRSRRATSRRGRSSRGSASTRPASRSTTSTARSWSSSSTTGPSRREPCGCHDAAVHDADRPGRVRHAGRPRRRRAGRADRRGRPADLPDLDLRPGRRRPAAPRLRVRPIAEPDPRAPRARRRAARGRHDRDRLRLRLGGHRRDRRAGRCRATRSWSATTSTAARIRYLERVHRGKGIDCPLRRPGLGPGRALGGALRADAAGLVREPDQPASQAGGHRGHGRDRAPASRRGRPAAAGRRGQHVRLAGAPAAAAAWGPTSSSTRRPSTWPATPTPILGVAVTSDAEVAERLRFLQNAMGAVPGPLDCFLVLRGLRTLHLRMERHGSNAAAVAQFLAGRPDIATVRYPGLASGPHAHPSAAAGRRRRCGSGGGMVSFVPAAGGRHGRSAAERAMRDRGGDPPVHPRRVARRRRVADRAAGGDDPPVGGRLSARGRSGARPPVGRHRGRRRPDRRPRGGARRA